MKEEIVQKPKRNVWLDIFRFFLAFLVICIHLNKKLFGVKFIALCRLGVVMFFMISGFFMRAETKEKQLEKIKKAFKRLWIYLGIGIAIVLTYYIIRNITNGAGLVDLVYQVFNPDNIFNFFTTNMILPFSGGAELWYLVAMIVLLMFHYVLVKYDKTKLYYVLIPVAIFFFMYPSYCTKFFSDFIISNDYRRNWMFFGIPCFGIGYLLSGLLKRKEKCKWWLVLIELAVALGFWILSYFEYKFIGDISYYFSTLVSAICFISFFDSISKREKVSNCEIKFSNFFHKWIGTNGALYIYITHMIPVMIFKELGLKTFVYNIATFAICFTVYELIHIIIVLVKQKKEKKKLLEQK